MLHAALFDYDGTLAETDAIHHACWNRVLAPFATEVDDAFYSRVCSGALSLGIAERMVAEFPQVTTSPSELAAAKDAFYQEWLETRSVPLRPGAAGLVRWLVEENVPVGVVTGAPRDAIGKTLHDHGLLPHFAVLITRERVTRGKPAPDGYQIALRELGVSAAASAVSLEDTQDGTLAAKAAGMRSVAIPQPYTAGHDFSAADCVVPSLDAARPWLQALLREAA